MLRPVSFTFGSYSVDTSRSVLSFSYHVDFASGKRATYTDRLYLHGVTPEQWTAVPEAILTPTLQALLLMLGINYWTVFPVKDIRIEGFSLTKEQAAFWNTIYTDGLGEYYFNMKMDFRGLVSFPFSEPAVVPTPPPFPRPHRSLLLNGAGKDSILSAEMLKEAGVPFDFFAFSPSYAHEQVAALVGAHTISVTRRRDQRIRLLGPLLGKSAAYPSVSTFTFIAVLLAELLGCDSIVFSNERSADQGNLSYLGLTVNHQWCKSSTAERITNDYIRRYICSDIHTHSLLRELSEIEIVERFVTHPQYLMHVTSCNSYFWFSRFEQRFVLRKPYWCRDCPKCMFLFACYAAFLPKQTVLKMFGGNMFKKRGKRRLLRRILGVEGFKPLDCVGEPEEMILAMEYAARSGAYDKTPLLREFRRHFPSTYDFKALEKKMGTTRRL